MAVFGYQNIKGNEFSTPIAAEALYKDCRNTYIIFSWRIFNYSQLRCHVLYFKLFENPEVKCVFKLFKTRRALYLCLRSKQISHKFALFHIDDETKYNLLFTRAQELMNGLYVGDFKNRMFLPGYLKNDMLTVSFRYTVSNQPVVTPVSHQHCEYLSDLSEFYNSMKYMYLASLHSDFTIRVDCCTFDVHKFVLASRSKFFEKFFSENAAAKEYSLYSQPGIVHMMLIYVYSGEIKKQEMISMIGMYDLARVLGIDDLSKKCLCLISESVDEWDPEILMHMAEGIKCPDLKKIVNQYVQKKKRKIKRNF